MSLPKILIIDDREFDRILYKEYLGDVNYGFRELDDGEMVLQELGESVPDLILLDWQMARVGGKDTLKLVKKSNAYKDVPIIIITGLKDEAVLEIAFDYGATDFLNKPVTSTELNARVRNVLSLVHAQKSLVEQQKELKELYNIVTSQKDQLKETLEYKEQLSQIKTNEFEKELQEKKRKMITQEVDSSKLVKHIEALSVDVTDCYALLKKENAESGVLRKLKSLERKMDDIVKSNGDSWEDFKNVYENLDPKFFKTLTHRNPKLTNLDLQHCAYIRMNVDNYELTRILNVEMKSLQMTRYRIKKKLKLPEKQTLREFVNSI